MKRLRVEVLGIQIDTLRKAEVLSELEKRIAANEKSFIITPYSEFFYLASKNYRLRKVLNSADLSLADGIGTVWAANYFTKPLTSSKFYNKVSEASFAAVLSLVKLFFYRKDIYHPIPEKISGSDFFWDLIHLANEKKQKVFLLGGSEKSVQRTKKKILEQFPNVVVAGTSSASHKDQNIVSEINASGADMLMVCFGPAKQEFWIHDHLNELNVKLAIGLGGTFDYISGEKIAPPKWLRGIGLEWLFRLITQPQRLVRIYHSTVSFVLMCIRHKVYSSMPFRPNVVGVILNKEGKVFVAKREFQHNENPDVTVEEHWQFPQGGTDGEEVSKAVLREVWEETGMKDLEILGQAEKKNTYTWNHTYRELFFNPLKYNGQEQTVFFLRHNGSNNDVKLDDKELSAYKWIEVSELRNVIHKYRENLLNIVLEDIQKYI